MPPLEMYEIKRGGVTVCRSETLVRCGYTEKQLKGMLADGYRYYVDGKPVRKAGGNGEDKN